MKINGEEKIFQDNMTVSQMLKREGYDSRVVVVEVCEEDFLSQIEKIPRTTGGNNSRRPCGGTVITYTDKSLY